MIHSIVSWRNFCRDRTQSNPRASRAVLPMKQARSGRLTGCVGAWPVSEGRIPDRRRRKSFGSYLLRGLLRDLDFEHLIEERAIVHDRFAKLLGISFAALIAYRNCLCCPVGLHHRGVLH